MLTQGPCWWCVHPSGKMDSSQKEFGRLVRHRDWCCFSPFDLSWVLPVGSNLWVLHSLPGPPVGRELMQVVTLFPGQGRWFRSVVPLTGSVHRFLPCFCCLGSDISVAGTLRPRLNCFPRGTVNFESPTLAQEAQPAAFSSQVSDKAQPASLNQMLNKQSIITLVYVCPKSLTWNRFILKNDLLFVWNFGLGVLYFCLLHLTTHPRAEYER